MCAESPDFPAGRGRADKALRAEDWLLPASLRGLRPVLPLLKAGCFWKSQPDPTNPPTVCCSSPCPNRCESRILQRLAQVQTLTGQDRCRRRQLALPWRHLRMLFPPTSAWPALAILLHLGMGVSSLPSMFMLFFFPPGVSVPKLIFFCLANS